MHNGVIPGTHNRLCTEALNLLRSSDLILQAGDVGRDGVLETMEVAIRSNADTTGRAAKLPDVQELEALCRALYPAKKPGKNQDSSTCPF